MTISRVVLALSVTVVVGLYLLTVAGLLAEGKDLAAALLIGALMAVWMLLS